MLRVILERRDVTDLFDKTFYCCKQGTLTKGYDSVQLTSSLR
jgi:hypothetical protein